MESGRRGADSSQSVFGEVDSSQSAFGEGRQGPIPHFSRLARLCGLRFLPKAVWRGCAGGFSCQNAFGEGDSSVFAFREARETKFGRKRPRQIGFGRNRLGGIGWRCAASRQTHRRALAQSVMHMNGHCSSWRDQRRKRDADSPGTTSKASGNRARPQPSLSCGVCKSARQWS